MRVLHVHTTLAWSRVAKRGFERKHGEHVRKSTDSETIMADGSIHRWATVGSEVRGIEWDVAFFDDACSDEERDRVAPFIGRRGSEH